MSWEFVIDTIKEWVLSLGYATEAWVLGKSYLPEADLLEWTTPLNVTGILIPDSTCMYFKAGMFGGKPYYRRQDGSFFIWWYGPPVSEWWISSLVGDADNGWYRGDPNIEGDYTPWHYSGTATVSKGYNYLKTGTVDRGDPVVADFTVGDFTKDSAWHDLDLSGIVPPGAKSVLFALWLKNSIIEKRFRLRKKGNIRTPNSANSTTIVANIYVFDDLECPCDSNRKVQYWFTIGGVYTIYLTVKGWRF